MVKYQEVRNEKKNTIDQIKIVSCQCYSEKWKNIKEKGDENWTFDEIENGKESFRKMFVHNMKLFHCCNDCLENKIKENPFLVNEETLAGFCVVKRFLAAISSVDEICNGCLSYFINKFEDKFFVF